MNERALISWIDGACVDEVPHSEIRAAIYRWKDSEPSSGARPEVDLVGLRSLAEKARD